jgi:thioredoxin 1
LTPILENATDATNGQVVLAKVNVDENRDHATKYGVRGIPTMLVFKAGQLVEQIVGNVAKENISAALTKHI